MHQKPSIEELGDNSRYEKVLTLSYGDIASFVISRLKALSWPMIFLWISLIAAALMSVWFWPGLRHTVEDPQIWKGLSFGLVIIPFLLIPVHEGLHLVPFRLSGARDIRFGMDLRQGIIYITAHRFVADGKLFSLVALTPFTVISASLVTAIIFTSPWWQWVLSLALLTHATMCAGDTAMLGFTWCYGTREVYTWDDADAREAYFFIRRD